AKRILQEGEISELRDPKLVDCNGVQFELMALAASLCIRSAPQTRPEIGTVLKLLQCDSEVIEWARQESMSCEEISDGSDREPITDIQSFLDLALLNTDEEEEEDDDDFGSGCRAERNSRPPVSVEG
ncbi:kinase family protein, partial [Genlisea aurea]